MMVMFYIALAFFMLICMVTCLIVLVQESKSMGLGASFGGDPGESLFGTSTAAVLKKITAWLAVIFVLSCVLLSLWSGALGRGKSIIELPSIEQVR